MLESTPRFLEGLPVIFSVDSGDLFYMMSGRAILPDDGSSCLTSQAAMMPSVSEKGKSISGASVVLQQLVPVIWAGAGLLVLLHAVPTLAQEVAKGVPAYRAFPLFGSRLAVWAIAQIHMNFAAFILGVPIFAVIVEAVGMHTRDPRYD